MITLSYLLQPHIFALFFLWIITVIPAYLRFVYTIQLKEYRADRLTDFFKTAQGHTFLLSYDVTGRLIFGLAVYTLLHGSLHPHAIYTIILVIDAVILFRKTYLSGLPRPAITKKAFFVVIAAVLLEELIISTLHIHEGFFIIAMSRLLIVLLVTVIFNIPTVAVKKMYTHMASRKLTRYPHLVVIGVTGSYGKSSVKEFLAHILSQSNSVIKTPQNTNTEIGIAKFILATDFAAAKYFVCEMGAYRVGEIGTISRMVKPTIGILTAISEQHLALFGSLKQTQRTKYELLRSIPGNGYVVTNSDNTYCTEFLHTLSAKSIETFGLDKEYAPDFLITEVHASLKGMRFQYSYGDKKWTIQTPVIGAHHATNIAPAIMVARHEGMPMRDIIAACESLPTNAHGSLQIFDANAATIIDDHYNSNTTGFRSALDVLAAHPSERKRIVITRGMMELGDKTREEHERMGEEIAFTADELIVISPDNYTALKDGVGIKYRTQVQLITEHDVLEKYVIDALGSDAVILIENRLPDHIYARIQEYKNK